MNRDCNESINVGEIISFDETGTVVTEVETGECGSDLNCSKVV